MVTEDGVNHSIEELLTALASRGGNWERSPLRNTPDREGWQDAIVGLIKDVGYSFSIKHCAFIPF
jgi:bromodomain adjacent to zinc finger domain protein 1A